MNRNNIRFDLSNYLIHFFRDVDLSSDRPVDIPEFMGWQNIHEGDFLPAFFMLRATLRNGRIWATWSIRNNQPTVYGYNPAICFTEMPIAAFLESGYKRRLAGEAMSPIALVFPKEALYNLGARQVISGGSEGSNVSSIKVKGGYRLLPESSFSLREQYRYVTYSLGERKIDWTHEREWRYPYRGESFNGISSPHGIGEAESWYEIGGLDFIDTKYRIHGIGVIVESDDQVNLILSDILTLVDSNRTSYHTFSFILNNSRLQNNLQQLQNPTETSKTILDATIDIEPYFKTISIEDENYNKIFSDIAMQIEQSTDDIISCEWGGCWLWFHDNKHSFTRALLKKGRIFVTKDGRYLAKLDEFRYTRDLRQREYMANQLADYIRNTFECECCYFSVSNSYSPTDLPFYAGKISQDTSYFNKSWKSM
ncbi:DUF4427 domain-containing protein [Psychrobacter sp. NG25]|uniref:DUF4427 domain-containing protein n=1 Tax=Psychrobacter sp. NG25 TaxID=2782005 RepID=UPI00188488C8|nr:DUF4427 domain-containing protein [Psychrobacter sp. NG25]MBF0657794.1 DUF4427 domain-containing protein [Psychrobacter sp. NG25]